MAHSEAEMVKGHALKHGFELTSEEDADFILVNACAVKEQTELKMLNRIKKLFELAEKNGSKLVIFGCLSKVSPDLIKKISSEIIITGISLEELSEILKIEEEPFSMKINPVRNNPYITIVPIESGCTSFCTFCATKIARGNLKSQPIEILKKGFESSLKKTKEFWLTGQDTGAYGLDINSSLPELLEKLLKVKGDYRIRIGMMNPQHLKRIYSKLIPLFEDERVYKFLHIPIQSGSNRILKLMNRGYASEDYVLLIEKLRKDIPNITIATDVIVGFPSETEKEFEETVKILKKTTPEFVNISRFGARPGTKAAEMPNQIHGRDKKERSRKITDLCQEISFKRNKPLLGLEEVAFFAEKGYKKGFIGHLANYRPVVIKENVLGEFKQVKVTKVHGFYLDAELI